MKLIVGLGPLVTYSSLKFDGDKKLVKHISIQPTDGQVEQGVGLLHFFIIGGQLLGI